MMEQVMGQTIERGEQERVTVKGEVIEPTSVGQKGRGKRGRLSPDERLRRLIEEQRRLEEAIKEERRKAAERARQERQKKLVAAGELLERLGWLDMLSEVEAILKGAGK